MKIWLSVLVSNRVPLHLSYFNPIRIFCAFFVHETQVLKPFLKRKSMKLKCFILSQKVYQMKPNTVEKWSKILSDDVKMVAKKKLKISVKARWQWIVQKALKCSYLGTFWRNNAYYTLK